MDVFPENKLPPLTTDSAPLAPATGKAAWKWILQRATLRSEVTRY